MKISSFSFLVIKSYQVVLLGILVQAFLVPFWVSMSEDYSSYGIIILVFILSILSYVGVIPMLLLYFNRTRKLGAFISIIIGSLPMIYLLFMFYLYLIGASNGPKTLYIFLNFGKIILGQTMIFSFIFLAGILYFCQKKQKIIFEKDNLK